MSRRFLAAALAFACALTGLVLAGPASAVVRPQAPSHLPTAIEPLAAYAANVSCDPVIKPGTRRLADLLVHTYPGTYYSSTYSCGTDGTISEHYDGRAIDWMVSIRSTRTYADAKAVISWLLATDAQGNRFAMARRLGVMYLIYNNRIWGSWDGTWEPYNNCSKQTSRGYDSSCHRDHMHISLGWNGAMGRTTFWTGAVAATDFGPCRAADLNWATPRRRANPQPCPYYRSVPVPAHASATKAALVHYSGSRLLRGSRGPAVSAVQRALHVSASGTFGTATRTAVRAFQQRHHLAGTGVVNVPTWRALLRAVR